MLTEIKILCNRGHNIISKTLRTMTKAEIVREISRKTGLECGAVAECVESFMDVMIGALAAGQPVYMRGFGTFSVKKRAAKMARNISQGTAIPVSARYIPHFKPSAKLKDAVSSSIPVK